MAQYYNAEEVFAAILKEILENGSSLPPVEEFVEDKLKGFAEQYVFMRQVTFIDYLDYAEQAIDEQRRIDREHLSKVNATTPQEFWKLCMSHNYDTPDKPNQGLTGLIHTYALPPFPLGKIYGITEVWLIAKPFLLPFSRCDTPTGKPVTSYPPSSNTYIGGVIHPDGYPSQYREKTSEAGSQFSMKRKDKWLDPDALRRWYPLGGLAYKRGKHFELTGHMLVMDIDHGRDHHPWIILASEWPDLCGEGEDGESGKWTAKKSQEITPDFVPGVFPADTRRTPIARIDHTADASFAQRARSMLLNFGPNFEFDLLRKGGRPVRDTPKWKAHHPDLVHVAQWYYDAKKNEELCFNKEGRIYMRYNLATGIYRHNDELESQFDGDMTLLGEFRSSEEFALGGSLPGPQKVELASRMGGTPTNIPGVRHSTSGYLR